MWLGKYTLLSLIMLAPGWIQAEPLVLESRGLKSVLVELYTSEGCNSCPPAERFLNRFTDNDELWSRYVPLAFHVDYWNDLGWVDRFSDASYSQRQRRYAQVKRQRTVYTPAFIVNGENWRPGMTKQDIDAPQTLSGHLKLEVEQGRILAHYDPAPGQSSALVLNVAVLGMGIQSNIEAGENSGKHAQHDFVVLAHKQSNVTGRGWQLTMPRPTPADATKNYALAAWVSKTDDPTPLQSVGGWLPERYMAP